MRNARSPAENVLGWDNSASLSFDEDVERFSSTNSLTRLKIVLCDNVISGQMDMSEDRRGTERRPTEFRVTASDRLRASGLFLLDPSHAILVLVVEDFLFPVLHLIEEFL